MVGGITESTVEEIKARVDLADLIASYGVVLKGAGATKKACCPFHAEKTPSFVINETRGFYHCFGCGEAGDAIKFVQKMEGLTFVEAVKKLADQTGVRIEAHEDPAAGKRKRLYALLAEIAQFYHRCLTQTKEAAPAREYLTSRELDGAISEDYLIGYAPSGIANILKWAEKHGYGTDELAAAGIIKEPNKPGDKGYHRFGGRLMFTIRDKQGRVVGFSGRQLVASKNSGKYVNSPETEVFKKSKVLYGFDKALRAITQTPHREVIVCEGQIDCIRLQTRGFPNAVAGQGTAFTEDHVQMLKKAADQVALVYDDDGAGHKATIKSARLCLAAGLPVRVVSLPDGDDPDSFLRTHPKEEFAAMMEGAASIMAFQVRAERAKERNPDTIDAVARITREVLLTIAQCPNAVIKASMLGEAADLLKLPRTALEDELGKARVTATRPVARKALPTTADDHTIPHDDEPPVEDEDNAPPTETEAPLTGEDAHKALPPPQRELALCAFLIANEYDKEIDGTVGEFLPEAIFTHSFTRRFVMTWRTQTAQGEDLLAPWGNALAGLERTWFDWLLVKQDLTQECAMTNAAVLEDLVRELWADALRRLRGQLSAQGDAASEDQRVTLTADIKRLATVKWPAAKEIIRNWRDAITQHNT